MQVTIKYGAGNEVTRNIAEGTTYEEVIQDPNLEAILGYSADSVEARVDGSTVVLDDTPCDGDTIRLTTKANSKAA